MSGMNDNIVIVPNAPDISGLRFRGFRGEMDYSNMVAVMEGCREEDGIERIETLESIANDCKHPHNFDPYMDMLFAEVGGDVIGYSRVFWMEEASGNLIYASYGWVLPAWRRKGIGRAMLHYNQARLRDIAAKHPGDRPHLFETYAHETEKALIALMTSEGYKPAVYFLYLVRPDLESLPDAPMPDGLDVRPVRSEHYRAIWEAHQEAFRDHWGYVPPKEEDYDYWLNHPVTFQPELWKVAWDGSEVVGQVRSFIDEKENAEYQRKRGYTEFISVRRPWRKRGLARSLLVQSIHTLKEHGMTEAALSVHIGNPNGALNLYESVGFRRTRMSVLYQKPMD